MLTSLTVITAMYAALPNLYCLRCTSESQQSKPSSGDGKRRLYRVVERADLSHCVEGH